MKLITIALLCSFFHSSLSGQPQVTMSVRSGMSNNDLQSLLYFNGVDFEKFRFSGAFLKGRNFQIVIREYTEGVVLKDDTVFNSNEDDYFRLKSDSLKFNVLTQVNAVGEFKIQFQFNGFSAGRKYQLIATEKDKFALKDFLGRERQKLITPIEENYILAYMLPFVRKDRSEAYCEVAQSGVNPERLFEKYGITHYFLIVIKFE